MVNDHIFLANLYYSPVMNKAWETKSFFTFKDQILTISYSNHLKRKNKNFVNL